MVVEAPSAVREDVKLSSLSEEVARRLSNTSLKLSLTERLEKNEGICVKKATSWHKEKFIREEALKDITKFEDKVSKSNL